MHNGLDQRAGISIMTSAVISAVTSAVTSAVVVVTLVVVVIVVIAVIDAHITLAVAGGAVTVTLTPTDSTVTVLAALSNREAKAAANVLLPTV